MDEKEFGGFGGHPERCQVPPEEQEAPKVEKPAEKPKSDEVKK